MGNDVSSQATMMAAKKKMSGALTSVEDQLGMKNKQNARSEPKTSNKDWSKMHQETDEVHTANQMKQKERVTTAKERWEANRKKAAK